MRLIYSEQESSAIVERARTAHAELHLTADSQPSETDLAWLRDQVLTAIRRGDERASIHESTSSRRISGPSARCPSAVLFCASM
jgi:hypothetical protein